MPAAERVAQARLVAEDGGEGGGADRLEGGEHLAEATLEAREEAEDAGPEERPTSAVTLWTGRGTTRITTFVTTPKTPDVPTKSWRASKPVLFFRSGRVRSRTVPSARTASRPRRFWRTSP
jgi:hypothetical protein